MVTPWSRLPSYTRLHTSVIHTLVFIHTTTHTVAVPNVAWVQLFLASLLPFSPLFLTMSPSLPNPKQPVKSSYGFWGTISTAVGCKAVSACLSPMLLSSCLPEKQSTAHLSPSLPVPAFLLRTMLEHSWGSAWAAVGALRWGLGRSLGQLCVWCRKSYSSVESLRVSVPLWKTRLSWPFRSETLTGPRLCSHTHPHTQLLAHLDTQPVTRSVVVIMLFRTLLFVINYAARTDTISYTTYPGVTDWVPQGVGQSVTSPNCPPVTVQVFAVYCNVPDPVICSL